jgi:hypothetical protein
MKPIIRPLLDAAAAKAGAGAGSGSGNVAGNGADMDAEFERELAQIEAESIGWQPLGQGAYLHVGSDAPVIEVVGQVSASMASGNVLLVI